MDDEPELQEGDRVLYIPADTEAIVARIEDGLIHLRLPGTETGVWVPKHSVRPL